MIDFITDTWDYLISFEWLSDIGEFFSGMFEGIGDFSTIGLIFALAIIVFVYSLRKYMLYPFLLHMGFFEYYFWMGVTYIGCGIMGYFVGKSLFDRD